MKAAMVRLGSWDMVAVFLLAGSVFSGCSGPPEVPRPGTHYDIFVDRTASITSGQRERWTRLARTLCEALPAGVSVDVYALHGRTTDAGALLSRETSPAPADATLEEVLRARRQHVDLKREVCETLTEGLAAPVVTDGTDIIGFIDILQHHHLATTHAILFTDGRQESRDLNLGARALRVEDVSSVVSALAEGRRWRRDALAGVGVTIVLDAASPDGRRSVNTHDTLRVFYTTLVTGLAGNVRAIDPDLQVGVLLRDAR